MTWETVHSEIARLLALPPSPEVEQQLREMERALDELEYLEMVKYVADREQIKKGC